MLQTSLTGITQDSRLQLVLIAFAFGAFFEGAAGFGTPVAVTAAILIGLGFKPSAGFRTLADCKHRAGGLWGPGYSDHYIGCGQWIAGDGLERYGRAKLPFFSILVPFWLVWAYAGFRGMRRGMAGNPGGRGLLCYSSIPHLQLPWPLAGGHHIFTGFAGSSHNILDEVASKTDLGNERA